MTIQEEILGVRQDFSCSADITTATRGNTVAVPIQALAVREDDQEEEREGVFVIRDAVVVFTPVEIGIAGERYFEVLDGLQEGDEVVTGPYAEVRELMDGDAVILEEAENDKDAGFSFSFSGSE